MSVLPQSKYSLGKTHTIPARSGVAVPLSQGQSIKVINTHGSQVIDTWAVIPPREPSDLEPPATKKAAKQVPMYEYMSMCHTRASNHHLSPLPGDKLVTNTRTPILQFLEDTTSPSCVHDTLMAACDIHRYHELGISEDEYHESCSDNFRAALHQDCQIAHFFPSPPDPLNLWMNIPVNLRSTPDGSISAGGSVTFESPVSKKGDYVILKAIQDCIVVVSACPQDILKINNHETTEAHFIVSE